MKTTTPKILLPAIALSCAFLIPIHAGEKAASVAPVPPPRGLLGENYAGISGAWYSYDDAPIDAQGVHFDLNWSLIRNMDFVMTFDWLETDPYFGVKGELQKILFGVRAFRTKKWASLYAEALGGVSSAKVDNIISEETFTVRLGVGAEIPVAPAFTLTPYAYYEENTDFYGSDGSFYYGLKGNTWVHQRASITASVQESDDGETTWTVGMNFRF